MKNIVLLGFMGTGKTTIAKRLSKKADMRYISTDDMIVERERVPINDIFSKKGEPHFRRVEREIVREVSDMSDIVIDAGGGVVLDAENVNNLKKNGILVCLWAEPGDILKRTKRFSHRPLLRVEEPLKKIKELLDKRKPYYERADYHINTSSVGVDETVDAIINFAEQKQRDENGR